MYPQIVSMLIHRMIMLTTTYYVPTTSPSSSATMQLTLEKKNKTHKKNTHKRQLGPFATSTTIILSVSEAWQHLFAKKQQQEQSKVGPVLVAPI